MKLYCKRCKRECYPWPIVRGAVCAPKDWAHCIAPLEHCEWKRWGDGEE